MLETITHRWLLRLAAPLTILAAVGSAAAVDVDFQKYVLPIFENKCTKCHSSPYEKGGKTIKPKGGLALDSAAGIVRGGSEGKVVVPGSIERSSLYQLTILPLTDEDRMPPPDSKIAHLTKREMLIFKLWIQQGAKFGKWVGKGPALKPKTSTGSRIAATGQARTPTQDQLQTLRDAGATVTPLVAGSPMLSVEFATEAGRISDSNLQKIAELAPNIVDLDLSRTKITDEGLAIIQQLPNLQRLNLSRTPVSNKGLAHLEGLRKLTHLNLWGTDVSEKGMKHLTSLTTLERLYLWKTKVNDDGYDLLKKSLRKTEIDWEEPD